VAWNLHGKAVRCVVEASFVTCNGIPSSVLDGTHSHNLAQQGAACPIAPPTVAGRDFCFLGMAFGFQTGRGKHAAPDFFEKNDPGASASEPFHAVNLRG